MAKHLGYLYSVTVCPVCGEEKAFITYEENRVYRMKCDNCDNVITHTNRSYDAAVKWFESLPKVYAKIDKDESEVK